MEEWQIQHITKNLLKLIRQTKFHCAVIAELQGNDILSQFDIDSLEAVNNKSGQSEASRQYYQLLMGRTNAYKVLTKALMQCNQSGAANILVRVPPALFSKPLTYLGISPELKNFEDVQVDVNGKLIKTHEFFSAVDIPKAVEIFKDCLSELEIYDTFITKTSTFVLSINSIPPKLPYYVPRFISNRIKLKASIFKDKCPDVFVFKKNIARYKLSEIARPNYTADSSSQLSKLTCRFIYLDDNEDWPELKKLAQKPIHLINFEVDGENFILEDSSDPSYILKKLDSKEDRVYLPEEEFVQQQLTSDCTSSSLCICDTPGMGKTVLLANIARRMTEKCKRRIIVFIQLTTFAKDWFPETQNTKLEPETSFTNVLSYICSPLQSPELLLKLVKAELNEVEIFFDGFDELSTDKVDWVKQVFHLIRMRFLNVRFYITSRPHMRQELEQSLGVVAYDILPFNQQNQVDFLVQFWKNKKPNSDEISLESFAIRCLEAVNTSLSKNEKEIAGIPLLCQLIAEVYSEKAAFRSTKRRRLSDVPLKISGMYQKFIENKINLVSKNKEEFHEIKLVHIWHAFELLFPKENFHKQSQFENVINLPTSPAILNSGILQKQSNQNLEFIHRTFAEFLVAEYLFTKIQGLYTSEDIYQEIKPMFRLLLQCQKTKVILLRYHYYYFLHPVIMNLFDSLLGDDDISEELKIQISMILSSFSNEEFIKILCSCCQHSLLNIFQLLSRGLTKCENTWILACFTNENSYELLSVCIKRSTSQMFHACIHLLTEVVNMELAQINNFDEFESLVKLAVSQGNFEAVEYFLDKVSLTNQNLLTECVTGYWISIEKRENILNLLLNKEPTLFHETPDILFTRWLDVRLFKILVKFGANLTAVDEDGDNCVICVAENMSPSDYHELVQFLLTDFKAEYLFLENEKWKDPMPKIMERVKLLPVTMELLLNIPGIDSSMKDRWEKSLLFHAVNADDLNELQQLVKRGLDFNARHLENRSLLHVAAEKGGAEMNCYLLSLKLDPNSRDDLGWTPLHYAALHGRLDVVEVLVENGANVQAKDNEGKTALHWAAGSWFGRYVEVIKYLIEKGAGVNDRDNYGETPLHSCWRSEEIKELLIEMGADSHAKNNNGQTPAQMNPKLWE